MPTATVDLAACEQVLAPLDQWSHQCHAASLRLVKSGVLGECRVARGACTGVSGQHSWVVLGDDCYDDDATIVDPTLWSYDENQDGIYVATYRESRRHGTLRHVPHGRGSIFKWGQPQSGGGAPIELTPSEPLSFAARAFLGLLGPLDYHGWAQLAHAPVGNWPAGEIFAAMADTKGLAVLIPIDILGMATDRNPNGLYLP